MTFQNELLGIHMSSNKTFKVKCKIGPDEDISHKKMEIDD